MLLIRYHWVLKIFQRFSVIIALATLSLHNLEDGMAIIVNQGAPMRKQILQEYLNQNASQTLIESEVTPDGKKLYMKGIFIQGDLKNANERIYPVHEIEKAVKTLNEQISSGYAVLGEVDHPDDLKINLDRVSHIVENMAMNGANGIGKLRILPTPMGQLVATMLESGVKLGVSSRGSGNVDDMNGKVSDFEIVTVDIVAQPSAPQAYPKAIYEGMMNLRHGHRMLDIAKDAQGNKKVEKYLKEGVMRLINDLKIK
jgi:hypothetical protein